MGESNRIQGIGLGLRMGFAQELLDDPPPELRWLEVHPENYMRRGGRFPSLLERAREAYPILTHGLTMCFGRTEPFEPEYLRDLRTFLDEIAPPWHSDHTCFSDAHGVFAHDLLPLPFTEESASTVVQRFTEARDALDRPLALENVSYYAHYAEGHRDECAFMLEVAERADAKLLLDVNNVYVNSRNHGFDPKAWIDRIPPERVVQYHVAGHFERPDGVRIDTHAEPVCDDVFALLEYTLKRIGPRPLLLERDGNFPPMAELRAELRRLGEIWQRATGQAAA